MQVDTIDLRDENINFKVEVRPKHISHNGERVPATIAITSTILTVEEAVRVSMAIQEAIKVAKSYNDK